MDWLQIPGFRSCSDRAGYLSLVDSEYCLRHPDPADVNRWLDSGAFTTCTAGSSRIEWGTMTLKEQILADLDLFYNTDDFAESVVYSLMKGLRRPSRH